MATTKVFPDWIQGLLNSAQNAINVQVNTSSSIQGQAASGSAVVGNPVLVGGSDGTNARILAVDSSGKASAKSADGDLATVGTTTDASSAFTLVGLLKKLVSLLPAALGAHGGLVVEGVASGTTVPISGTVTATVASTSANQGTAAAAVTSAWPVGPGIVGTSIDGSTAAMTGTTATTVIPLTTGKRHYITTIVVSNSSATATLVTISGLASTNTITIPAPASIAGAVVTFPTPLVCATSTALTATCVTTGSSTIVSAVGYDQ